jgi:hypothetical protein
MKRLVLRIFHGCETPILQPGIPLFPSQKKPETRRGYYPPLDNRVVAGRRE